MCSGKLSAKLAGCSGGSFDLTLYACVVVVVTALGPKHRLTDKRHSCRCTHSTVKVKCCLSLLFPRCTSPHFRHVSPPLFLSPPQGADGRTATAFLSRFAERRHLTHMSTVVPPTASTSPSAAGGSDGSVASGGGGGVRSRAAAPSPPAHSRHAVHALPTLTPSATLEEEVEETKRRTAQLQNDCTRLDVENAELEDKILRTTNLVAALREKAASVRRLAVMFVSPFRVTRVFQPTFPCVSWTALRKLQPSDCKTRSRQLQCCRRKRHSWTKKWRS